MKKSLSEKKRLSETVLKNLKPKEKTFVVRDTKCRGFLVRVEPSGKKLTFYLQRKTKDGRARWKKLGDYPDLSVRDAREKAEIKNAQLAKGVNVFDQLREEREEMTIGDLWKDYIEQHAEPNLKQSTIRQATWQFEKHLSRWKKRRVSEVGRRDVVRLTEAIKKKDGPIAANRVRALLSVLYNTAEKRGFDVTNPVRGPSPFKEQPRERYLNREELGRFLRSAFADGDADLRDALLLLLYTGARKGNVLAAEWAWIDLKEAVMVIPARAMKANRPLLVPLTPEAVKILRQRRKDADGDQKFVFPSHSVRGHLYDIRGGMNRVLERAKISEKVTPHDLRRTTATWMLGEGADIEIVARLLSHATFGVTSTYAKAGIELMRTNLERTVRAMLATLDDKDGTATVLDFPTATRSGQ